jgi:hypothetical protein
VVAVKHCIGLEVSQEPSLKAGFHEHIRKSAYDFGSGPEGVRGARRQHPSEIRMGKRITPLLKQASSYGYALDTGNQGGRLRRLLKGWSARVIVTIEKAAPTYRARGLEEIHDLGRHAR